MKSPQIRPLSSIQRPEFFVGRGDEEWAGTLYGRDITQREASLYTVLMDYPSRVVHANYIAHLTQLRLADKIDADHFQALVYWADNQIKDLT